MYVSKELLRELASLEQTGRTIISAYINLRLGWDRAEEELREEIERLGPVLTSEEKEYFNTSVEFIFDYFEKQRESNFNGPAMAFFIDLGEGYSTGVELTIPHKTSVSADNQAIIMPLAMELDEFEPVGVIIADASGARISISAGKVIDDMHAIDVKIHHLSKVGGWSQMRYQRRRDKQILHFAKDVADAAVEIFSNQKVNRILLAGRDRILTAIESELPQKWRKMVVETIKWDLAVSDDEFILKIAPALVRAEREQEQQILARFLSEYRRGGLAKAGIIHVQKALELGQVDTLIVDQDIDSALLEELVSKAQTISAFVEFVPPRNAKLAKFGGVGALLRYSLD